MVDRLPIKLTKEPLVDAIFELRFSSTTSASNILPGFLFSKLDGDKIISSLPAGNLPRQVRDVEPSLQYAPLVQLNWNGFTLLIGDLSLGIVCKFPYPGWAVFEPVIRQIVGFVRESGIVQAVQRFSMRYIDLIPSSDLSEQASMIFKPVIIGNYTLENEVFSFKIEIPENQFLHIVNIVSSSVAKLQDGSERSGLIVDIDTVVRIQHQEFEPWVEHLPSHIEEIHMANKKMFFRCLQPETIAALEPVYE